MEPDPVTELLDIAQALRVHLEWQRQTGCTGLPRDVPALTTVEALPQQQPTATVESATPPPVAAAPVAVAVTRAAEPVAIAATRAAAVAPSVEAPSEPVDDTPEGRQRRLEVLREVVRGCTRCGLSAGRTNTVFARGTGSSGLCFIGEGPGADEDAQGYPFVGAAGQLLDRMIGAMGLSRDEVYVCNIVKCRPPQNRKPEPDEMAACMPYLTEQIELIDPQVIVALGATAVQGLLGTNEGIMRLRGQWKLYRGRIAVMPTFHPAYLLRTPDAKRDVWSDLQAVLRQMGRMLPSRPPKP